MGFFCYGMGIILWSWCCFFWVVCIDLLCWWYWCGLVNFVGMNVELLWDWVKKDNMMFGVCIVGCVGNGFYFVSVVLICVEMVVMLVWLVSLVFSMFIILFMFCGLVVLVCVIVVWILVVILVFDSCVGM